MSIDKDVAARGVFGSGFTVIPKDPAISMNLLLANSPLLSAKTFSGPGSDISRPFGSPVYQFGRRKKVF